MTWADRYRREAEGARLLAESLFENGCEDEAKGMLLIAETYEQLVEEEIEKEKEKSR